MDMDTDMSIVGLFRTYWYWITTEVAEAGIKIGPSSIYWYETTIKATKTIVYGADTDMSL